MSLSNPPRPAPRARLLPGMSLRVGDILGSRFRLESLVLAERSRILLQATQTVTRVPVTIEIFVPVGEGADEARVAFVAASRRSAVLNGPHVAKVLHAGVTPDGQPYVAREPAPARTLAQLLAERIALETSEAVDLAIALCDALGEAHGHGMIHGAIDPRAVRIERDEIKLMDFETASIFVDLHVDPMACLSMRAPEQLRMGGVVDARADIFALGALLFVMVAGASPFAADSPSGTALAVNDDDPAFLAGVDDALAELVEQCLAKDAADRPADVAELAERLAPFASPRAESALARIRDRARVLASETVMVDRKAYEALAQERAAEIEIEIDFEDVESPTPAPVSRSVAPVAMDRPTVIVPRKRSYRAAFVALGLVAGAAIGALSEKWMQDPPTASAATPPPALTAELPVAKAEPAPTLAPAATPAPTAIQAPAPSAKPAASAKPIASAKPTAKPVAAILAKAPKPQPKTEPALEQAEPTPEPKPEATPKESDDDLRRFLEDRR